PRCGERVRTALPESRGTCIDPAFALTKAASGSLDKQTFCDTCHSEIASPRRRWQARRHKIRKIVMYLATLVLSVAVPVAIVLLALVIHAPLSTLFWRQFLKLSD